MEVLSAIDGYAGVITLNRPQALNALSFDMIQEIGRLLKIWKDNPQVHIVIMRSACNKAFCAGGDVRSVYDAHLRDDKDFMETIFQEEYLLNAIIHIYPKPYIALIDGLSMGGGMGISILGSHRVVTERAILAMPETNIGFFPDVGAGYFLNQCPGEIGTYMAVWGESISSDDALYAGLATHCVASSDLSSLYQELTHAQTEADVNDILQDAAGGQRDCFLQSHRRLIDHCFSQPTLEEIIEALQQEHTPIAQEWLRKCWRKSPTSMKFALAMMRNCKGKDLKDVLALNFQMSRHFVANHDFFEGIRATLVDKDHNPLWKPSQLSEITNQMVENYFSSNG